jgi:4-hydroxy-3-methylbut-2-en-1-yl diphosphate synthase IspG/GcpE
VGEDGDLGGGDGVSDCLAEASDSFLHLGHTEAGMKFEKDFDEDLGSGTATADFMKTVIVVDVAD